MYFCHKCPILKESTVPASAQQGTMLLQMSDSFYLNEACIPPKSCDETNCCMTQVRFIFFQGGDGVGNMVPGYKTILILNTLSMPSKML